MERATGPALLVWRAASGAISLGRAVVEPRTTSVALEQHIKLTTLNSTSHRDAPLKPASSAAQRLCAEVIAHEPSSHDPLHSRSCRRGQVSVPASQCSHLARSSIWPCGPPKNSLPVRISRASLGSGERELANGRASQSAKDLHHIAGPAVVLQWSCSSFQPVSITMVVALTSTACIHLASKSPSISPLHHMSATGEAAC